MILISFPVVEASSIRYSQSTITKWAGDHQIDITQPFDLSRYRPIKIVDYNGSSNVRDYTSYDNRRLYWTRGQSHIQCFVKGAMNSCLPEQYSERIATVSWPDGANLREGLIMAKRYDACISLRCAYQGQSFPMHGRELLPIVRAGQPHHTHVTTCPTPTVAHLLPVDEFFRDLEHLDQVYLAGGGPSRFANDYFLHFLRDDGFSKFDVIEYRLIENCSIKMRGAADHWDHEAYEKEYDRLVQIGDINDAEQSEVHVALGSHPPEKSPQPEMIIREEG